jgi:hypothetical protein
MGYTCRVVDKVNFEKQYFFDVEEKSLPGLGALSVRVKPSLLSLQGSSNLAYCALGTILHWWDAYPAPSYAPPPYNDSTKYGVAPCWGFASVTGSNVRGIEVGSVVWGYLPTHTCPVDLQLQASEQVPGHWIETTQHRSQLMPLYNRFVVLPASTLKEPNLKAAMYTAAMRSVWECGYTMNRFNFPHNVQDPCLHPMPESGLPWSKQDGDISKALVVCLGAGGKTSRSFVHQLATNRSPGSGPVGVLEISSKTDSLLSGRKLSFQHRVLTYEDASHQRSVYWVKSLGVERMVIVEMGGRNNILEKFTKMVKDELPNVKVDVIFVGGEMKIPTGEEIQQQLGLFSGQAGVTPMNTSGLRSAAMEILGEDKYFEQVEGEWQKVVKDELETNPKSQVLNVKLKVGHGIKGEDGLEDTWTAICESRYGGEALVFHM